MNPKITAIEISRALRESGVNPGDTVCTHLFLGAFGPFEAGMRTVLDGFLHAIEEDGTMAVPTFNYDFCRGIPYDHDNSPSQVGQFTEFVRTLPEASRSFHPVYSYSVLGKKKDYYLQNPSPSGFGKDSFFERLHRDKAKLVYFGCNFRQGATFLHYVEEMLNVPYRFVKDFHGNITRNGDTFKYTASIFSRFLDLDVPVETDFMRLQQHLLDIGHAKKVTLGRGEIITVPAPVFFDDAIQKYNKDPQFFLVNPLDFSKIIKRKSSS